MTTTLYPIVTPERRKIVQKLGELAEELEAEVRVRTVRAEADHRYDLGGWNAVVADELARSAGTIRFVATLIVQGGMSTGRARFWLASTVAYLKLVRLSDNAGVIR